MILITYCPPLKNLRVSSAFITLSKRAGRRTLDFKAALTVAIIYLFLVYKEKKKKKKKNFGMREIGCLEALYI
jgi:hypothetical protein